MDDSGVMYNSIQIKHARDIFINSVHVQIGYGKKSILLKSKLTTQFLTY